MKTGPRNLITDVAGLRVGNADDKQLKSGSTVLICDTPAIASVHVMGGAPGTRETDLLSPEQTVETVDAITLSGGSAFGLDAASGVQALLREQGRGFSVGGKVNVPIVPAAILFDLINGGNKDWGRYPPYRELGYEAASKATHAFQLGSIGAGTGATTANLKGGLGSASTRTENGITIGALVAVNALGQATMGSSPTFWAHPFEIDDEFGGQSWPSDKPEGCHNIRSKLDAQTSGTNTTIGIIATDAALTKAEAKRLAVMAHDGFARALWPSHTPLDGDLIFALSTGQTALSESRSELMQLGSLAASTMARAIARGIYAASQEDGDSLPTWISRFGPKP